MALQLRSSSLAELEAELRNAKERRSSNQEQQMRLEAQLSEIETRIAGEGLQSETRSQFESIKLRVAAEIELVKERSWSFGQRVIDLESDIARRRRDIRGLEELVANELAEFTR